MISRSRGVQGIFRWVFERRVLRGMPRMRWEVSRCGYGGRGMEAYV